MDRRAARTTVRVLDDAGDDLVQMAREVRTGLLSSPKDLSPWPKYFYDVKGSELFEEITALPEYYQTRTELSILEAAGSSSSSGAARRARRVPCSTR
jgi:uncharacterized SAM-dependent methyltransferase